MFFLFNNTETTADATPVSWSELKRLQDTDRARLTRVDIHLPPADVDDLLVNHEEHLGLHLRNTKFLASKVRI